MKQNMPEMLNHEDTGENGHGQEEASKNLDLAKHSLETEGCTCVLVKGSEIYKSTRHGIAPLLAWIGQGIDVSGYSAADQIVGKAAALLYVRMGVTEVYAQVVSEPARQVLADHGILLRYDKLVPWIINRRGDGMCPMEQTVLQISDPEKALAALREKVRILAAQNDQK